ncbi:MAG TPA: 50S ribosomal protein L24 [Candidatus Dojkabacteria bacterium]|jgi:large subunit ribosomal protein L24
MKKIQKGDTIKVINGKDKGKTGEVIKVFPKVEKIVVKGINIITKHKKQTGVNAKAGKFRVEAPIFVSKVMIIDPKNGKTTRVKFEIDEKTGKKYRVSVKSGTKLDK